MQLLLALYPVYQELLFYYKHWENSKREGKWYESQVDKTKQKLDRHVDYSEVSEYRRQSFLR